MTIKKIYLTHCCAKKNSSVGKNKHVTADMLYLATPTRRFMKKCKESELRWAIFSDKYGVWFDNIKHNWYEKNPNSVSREEFNNLVEDFDTKLKKFDEIWFYHNPGRFHRLYRKLIETSTLKDRIRLFTHIQEN